MIGEKIFSILGPLVDNRVFPSDAPINTQKPYVIWQKIGGESIATLSGDIPDKQNSFIQIKVWDSSQLLASRLAQQIEDTLRTSAEIQASPQNEPIDLREADLGLYGTMQDFNIWSQR